MLVQLLAAQMNARNQSIAETAFAEVRQCGLANVVPKGSAYACMNACVSNHRKGMGFWGQ